MIPTFDIWNTVKLAGRQLLLTSTGPLPFLLTVSAIVGGIIANLIQHFTSWQIPQISVGFLSDFNSEVSSIILYSIRADLAVTMYNFIVAVISVLVPFLASSVISLLGLCWAWVSLRSVRRTILDWLT